MKRRESGKRKAEGGKRKAESGRRKAEGGKRKVEGGKRKAEGGKRKAEGGKRKAERAICPGRRSPPRQAPGDLVLPFQGGEEICLTPPAKENFKWINGAFVLPKFFWLRPNAGAPLPNCHCRRKIRRAFSPK